MAITSAAALPANTVLLRGTIVSASATALVVNTGSGNKTVSFGPKMRFLGLAHSSLDKVSTGSFIGTTVVPQPNGTYVSSEVHIFAPSLRGMGEGFTKMNSRGTRMMANSTVRSVTRSTNMMANSTVRTVASSSAGKHITLVFKSGTKNITIPLNTPIFYIEPGSKAMLVRGAHVRLAATSNGKGLVAKTLLVGEHGTILPM